MDGKKHIVIVYGVMVPLLCFLSAIASAENYLIVSPDNKPYYLQAVKGIKQALSANDHIQLVPNNQIPSNQHFDAVIALGVNSAKTIIKNHYFVHQKVIFSLVPHASIAPLLKEYPSKRYRVLGIDQPVFRQSNIAKHFFPNIRNIALVYADKEFIRDLPATVAGIQVHDKAQVINNIKKALQGFDAVIAVADPLVYSRKNLRNIILSSVKLKKPLIGFSASMVKAGALISAYTPPLEIGRQSLRLAKTVLLQTEPNRLLYPQQFYIKFNQTVADILLLSPVQPIKQNRLYRDEDLM